MRGRRRRPPSRRRTRDSPKKEQERVLQRIQTGRTEKAVTIPEKNQRILLKIETNIHIILTFE